MEPTAVGSDSGLSPERLARLRATKLAALVATHIGIAPEPSGEPPSSLSAVVVDGQVFGLVEQASDFGRLLHWAARRLTSGPSGERTFPLTVFAEPAAAPDVARQAPLVSPDIEVLAVTGANVVSAAPRPLDPPPTLGVEMWQAASAMADAGARVVDDHGRLVADVMGLEVARLTTEGMSVGVGEADRELHGYVHGHLDQVDALARAVETVRSLRPIPSHPLNRLARPRWLRSVLLDDPALVGLGHLEPLPPLAPLEGVFNREPAAAYSAGSGSDPGVTVVCSTGVDLNLLPEALDYRYRTDPVSRLMLVLPERDRALAVDPLAAMLAEPGILDIRSVQLPWESVPS